MSSINTQFQSTTDSGNLVFSGLTSGIDTQSIINALMTARRAPAVQIENKIADNTTKLTDLGDLRTLANSFTSTLDTLKGNNSLSTTDVFNSRLAFTAAAAASGAPADHTPSQAGEIVGVSAGSGAETGQYRVIVNQRAQAHQIQSDVITSTTTALNDLDANFVGTFTVNGETVTIDSDDTLLDARDKINNTNSGVTATIVSASDTAHYLVLTSDDTGVDNEMTFGAGTSVSDTFGLTSGGAINAGNVLRDGLNAQLTVNGISGIERASNTITDVIDGLTFSVFKAEADTEITIDVENDLTSITTAVSNFVDQYNAMRSFITDQRTERVRDADNPNADAEFGSLYGNTILRQLEDRLNSVISDEVAGLSDGFQSLSQIGITVSNSFELEIDATTFNEKILSDVDAVRKVFAFDAQTSDARLSVIGRDGSTDYTVDGSNVVEPLYLNLAGIDASGNITGGNISTSSGNGTADDSSLSLSGKTITVETGLGDGLIMFFDGADSLGAVADIEVTYTRGVADQLYDFFNDLTKLDGQIDEYEETVTDQNTDYEEQVVRIDERLAIVRAQLSQQFLAMETALSELENLRSTIESFTAAQNADN